MTTYTARQIARVAYEAGFRGERLVTAVAVALAESSGRVEVVNAIGCVGLWQINQPVHVEDHPAWSRAYLQNAQHNADAAWVVSGRGATWNPWTTFTSGSYKKHLPVARSGAAGVTSGPVKQGPHGGGKDDDGNDDKDNPSKPPKPPKAEPDPNPRVRLGSIWMHGGQLKKELADAVTGASLSWSVTDTTQLSLTVADPGFVLWSTGLFEKGAAIMYRDPDMPKGIDLRVVSRQVDGGTAGTGGFTINARSEGVWKLKKRRGPLVMKGASPTDFVERECKAAGLGCVAQPSAKRGHVARDVAKKGEDTQGSAKPSSFTTFGRLATELGYLMFEFMGTVYFGKPSWLIDRDDEPLQVALPLPGAPEVWMARSIPSISNSEDAAVPVEVSDLLIEKARFKDCRPGGAMRLRGLPPFNMKLLLTSLDMPLLGTDPLTLSAQTPVNPEPQPPAKAGGKGTGAYDDGHGVFAGAGANGATGAKSGAAFVNMAVTASNARYVYGAEASSSDPTPSAVDCSELVQWALGRIGIPFVDGSSAQYAACTKISVAQAMGTRGALLHKEGHIGISMGDGRSVEARNPTDGVGIFRAADIAWTGGGLVPGLSY